jgi:hypothetical protein
LTRAELSSVLNVIGALVLGCCVLGASDDERRT